MLVDSRKLLRACLAVVAMTMAFAAPTSANPGQLDASFGEGGKLTTDFATGVDEANAVAIDSLGRIVVAGSAETRKAFEVDSIAIARYLPDGSPDPTFGGGDGLVTAAADTYTHARSLAIDDQDRIIVGGYYTEEFLPTGIVARFTTSGEIDPTFGEAGFAGFDFEAGGQVDPGLSNVGEVRIAPDGQIYAGGYINHYEGTLPSPAEMAVTRLNQDGSTDESFADDGFAHPWGTGKYSRLNTMDLLPNGQIVVAGSKGAYRYRVAVARLKANGSIDRRFGDEGETTLFSGKAVGSANSVGVDSRGKIVVAGCTGTGTRKNSLEQGFLVVRLTKKGVPDQSFAGDGIRRVPFGIGYRCASSALLPGGSIIAGGYAASNSYSRTAQDFALAKLTNRGRLDRGFGEKGEVRTDFGKNGDQIRRLAFAPGGRIIAAGVAHNGGRSDFGVAAYQR